MTTIDGMTVEERGGPERTSDRALYAERCRVVGLEKRLAEAEARAERLEEAVRRWADVAGLPLDEHCHPDAVASYMEAARRMRELAGCALAPPADGGGGE